MNSDGSVCAIVVATMFLHKHTVCDNNASKTTMTSRRSIRHRTNPSSTFRCHSHRRNLSLHSHSMYVNSTSNYLNNSCHSINNRTHAYRLRPPIVIVTTCLCIGMPCMTIACNTNKMNARSSVRHCLNAYVVWFRLQRRHCSHCSIATCITRCVKHNTNS